ncbi:MAG: monovalent cation/H(+) antiporter subunit G [Pseudomonadota bacterium]
MIDWLVGVIVLLGGFFALIGALGIVRMPDVLTRMHASTKAGTLGCTLVLIALALRETELTVTLRVLAAIFILVMTAPLAAHAIGRAAVKTGVPLRLRPGSKPPE